MQERFQRRLRVEIPGVAPELQVRDEQRAAQHLRAELAEFQRQHDQPTDAETGRDHHQQGGQDAPDAMGIEAPQAEPRLGAFPQDDPRDEVARDHEEHVDAQEAPRRCFGKAMEQHHREHRDGPQPIDIRAIPAFAGSGQFCLPGDQAVFVACAGSSRLCTAAITRAGSSSMPYHRGMRTSRAARSSVIGKGAASRP